MQGRTRLSTVAKPHTGGLEEKPFMATVSRRESPPPKEFPPQEPLYNDFSRIKVAQKDEDINATEVTRHCAKRLQDSDSLGSARMIPCTPSNKKPTGARRALHGRLSSPESNASVTRRKLPRPTCDSVHLIVSSNS